MSQADLEDLRELIRQLTARVSQLEALLLSTPAADKALADLRGAEPPQEAPALAATLDIVPHPPVDDTTAMLPVAGIAVLGLAGAYLLRAVAESGVFPARFTFTLAVLYSVAWLLWSGRSPAERKPAVWLYALTSVMILPPLLWEAATRFGLVTAGEASVILVAFCMIGLAVSWQRNLLVVATLSTLAAVGTAGALLIGTHNVLPFTFAFLAIAAAVEICASLNHGLGQRWLAAGVADFSVLLATWLVTNPNGLPEVYAPLPATYLFTAQIALVVVYLSSVMVRTLLRGFQFTSFETVQCVLAFVIGVGGALRLSAGDPRFSLAIAAFLLVCGASCYTISFGVLERHGSHGRNFFTYSTFGILLVFAGYRMLLGGASLGVVFSALALGCMGAGNLWSKLMLEVHAGVYLLLALSHSGAIQQATRFLLGDDVWPGIAATALAAGSAVAAVVYLLALGSAPAIGGARKFIAFRLGLAIVMTWQILGVTTGGMTGILHALSGFAPGDPYCATVRTGAFVAAALLLAAVSSRAGFQDFSKLVYPLMIVAAGRLVGIDLRQDHKTSLFLSLLFFGAALMLIPRLRRNQASNRRGPRFNFL